MKPGGAIKLVSELLDLPLCDAEGKYCGIVDDIELDGAAGKKLELKALLVGPGAYRGRMPKWVMALVKAIAGSRMTRVPLTEVDSIGSAVILKRTGGELGLHRSENVAGRWIPHEGAL